MLKIASLIENPGEPPVESRYHQPTELRDLGYNALVIYNTTALSGLTDPQVIDDREMQRWVVQHIEQVTARIEAIRSAGLAVYLFYDMLVLPRDLVLRDAQALCCRNRPGMLCPASDKAMAHAQAGLAAMLERWPQVDGIVLRFGDTDAARLPFLEGNDLYTPHCSRCSRMGRADRLVAAIDIAHRVVVGQHTKRLIVRAWNVRPNGLHDSAELARRVATRLPGRADDDRLILSFKFTQTDFWRYQRWNEASLQFGRRPIIYEFQCQREFEGKGGMPNYQIPLWRDGAPEAWREGEPSGLAAVSNLVNLAGLWGWVRGGGWGGPFIKSESWIDANAYGLTRLADNPQADPRELALQWAHERLGVSDEATAQTLAEILMGSPDLIRDAFYIGPFAGQKVSQWHPNGDWIQDDLLDVEATWRIMQRLPEAQINQAVLEKKHAAERIAHDRAALQHHLQETRQSELEPLVHSLIYTESFIEALRDLMAGIAAYRRFQRKGQREDAQRVRQFLLAAQNHWNHHAQRHGSLPGAATAFRESGFWEITQQMLQRVGDA